MADYRAQRQANFVVTFTHEGASHDENCLLEGYARQLVEDISTARGPFLPYCDLGTTVELFDVSQGKVIESVKVTRSA